MSRPTPAFHIVLGVLLGAAGLLLGLLAVLSIRWPMEHDAPILFYIAWLLDEHGRVPYRDVYGFNMPAVYGLHAGFGRVFSAYDDLGFRIVDLLHLGVLLTASWMWMRALGRWVAGFGAALFGIWYLGQGTDLSLQREYMFLVPVVLALVVARSEGAGAMAGGLGSRPRAVIVGMLFGIAAAIKPPAVLGLPFVLWHVIQEARDRGETLSTARTLMAAGLGFCVAPLLVTVWLVATGSTSAFLDMARGYWPLYSSLTRKHAVLEGSRAGYLAEEFLRFGKQRWLLLPAVVGAVAALLTPMHRIQRRQVWLLITLALAYAVYTLVAGKFWVYHWIPFVYFALQLAALSFVRQEGRGAAVRTTVPLVVLAVAVALGLRWSPITTAQLGGEPIPRTKGGRVEEIATFLRQHVEPGDTVQPLDWTGGAVHAMLRARVELATSFVYDFHFYHHVRDGYVQGLRARFLRELEAAPPTFVIEVIDRKPWPSGPGTSRQFSELRRFLNTRYERVVQRPGYIIHERLSEPRTGTIRPTG